MKWPTKDMVDMMGRAARESGVPLTLLMALARVETGFDLAYSAPQPSSAKGLYGLTEPLRIDFGMTDALDLKQNVSTCARAFRALLSQEVWKGSIGISVASFYYAKAGPKLHTFSLTSGALKVANLGSDYKLWPADVRKYVDAVMRSRREFMDQALPVGKTRAEQLKNAIDALYARNEPAWCASVELDKLKEHAADQVKTESESMLGWLNMFTLEKILSIWTLYEAAYQKAPITDSTTPAPWKLEPRFWSTKQPDGSSGIMGPLLRGYDELALQVKDKFIEPIKKGVENINEAGRELGEKIEDAFLYVGIGAFALGVVWILANRRSS